MSNSAKQFAVIVGILLVLGGGIFFVITLLTMSRPEHQEVVTGHGDRIAVVEVNGIITSSKEVVRQIKKYREDRGVRAILLRIDSPGGGVVASHEMYDEIRKTRDGGKPVVASMGALAASGGYYIACGASKIMANPGTLTGSIGVISEFIQVDTLLQKLGITSNTVKSGKMKDAGNPMRPMTPAEKEYFQGLMDNVHRQFIDIVERERHIGRDTLDAIADGRVFTGEMAAAQHLIDTLGTYEDAILLAGALAGIQGTPAVVREERRRFGFWDLLFGEDGTNTLMSLREEILGRPTLQYTMPGLR